MADRNGNNGNSRGSEHRHYARRNKKDRRDLVRWEPDKSERRHGYGRRSHDSPKIRG